MGFSKETSLKDSIVRNETLHSLIASLVLTCSELDGEFLIKPQPEYSAVSAHLSGFNSKHACLSHITAEI